MRIPALAFLVPSYYRQGYVDRVERIIKRASRSRVVSTFDVEKILDRFAYKWGVSHGILWSAFTRRNGYFATAKGGSILSHRETVSTTMVIKTREAWKEGRPFCQLPNYLEEEYYDDACRLCGAIHCADRQCRALRAFHRLYKGRDKWGIDKLEGVDRIAFVASMYLREAATPKHKRKKSTAEFFKRFD